MTTTATTWTLRQLVDKGAMIVNDGYRAKLNELGGAGPLFLRAGALTESGFDWTGLDTFVAAESAFRLKTGRPDDVVITTKGNSIGRVGIIPQSAPTFVYSPHLSYWRVIEPKLVEPRYLYYWTRSDGFRKQLRNLAFGTDMAPYFSLRDQLSVTIRLPLRREQRATAEVLGALDDKIAVNTRIATRANTLAALAYRKALMGAEFRPLASVLSPVLGGTPSKARKEFWDGDRLWASARDVANATEGLLLDTEQKITAKAVESTKARPLPRGSVILTARGTVGAVSRMAQPASFNQSCYGFAPGALPAGVLYFAIVDAASKTRELAHGSVFDTITMKSFNSLLVPDPESLDLTAIESGISPLLSTVECSLRESRALAALRDTLLPALMSGKLRVRDAERQVEEVV